MPSILHDTHSSIVSVYCLMDVVVILRGFQCLQYLGSLCTGMSSHVFVHVWMWV